MTVMPIFFLLWSVLLLVLQTILIGLCDVTHLTARGLMFIGEPAAPGVPDPQTLRDLK